MINLSKIEKQIREASFNFFNKEDLRDIAVKVLDLLNRLKAKENEFFVIGTLGGEGSELNKFKSEISEFEIQVFGEKDYIGFYLTDIESSLMDGSKNVGMYTQELYPILGMYTAPYFNKDINYSNLMKYYSREISQIYVSDFDYGVNEKYLKNKPFIGLSVQKIIKKGVINNFLGKNKSIYTLFISIPVKTEIEKNIIIEKKLEGILKNTEIPTELKNDMLKSISRKEEVVDLTYNVKEVSYTEFLKHYYEEYRDDIFDCERAFIEEKILFSNAKNKSIPKYDSKNDTNNYYELKENIRKQIRNENIINHNKNLFSEYQTGIYVKSKDSKVVGRFYDCNTDDRYIYVYNPNSKY